MVNYCHDILNIAINFNMKNKQAILVIILLISLSNTGYVSYFHFHEKHPCSSGICHAEKLNCEGAGYSSKDNSKHFGSCPICELIAVSEKNAVIIEFVLIPNCCTIDSGNIVYISFLSDSPKLFFPRAPPAIRVEYS